MIIQCTLTPKILQHAVCEQGAFVDYKDVYTTGLYLRVRNTEHKEFSFLYTHNGQQHRITIGDSQLVDLPQSRQDAEHLRAKITLGIDPKNDIPTYIPQNTHITDTPHTPIISVQACIQDFLHHRTHLRTFEWYKRRMKHIPDNFHEYPMCDFSKHHIKQIMDTVSESSGMCAGKDFLAIMKSFFNWALDQEYIQKNPIQSLKHSMPYQPRDRFLTDTEIKSVWRYADTVGYPFGHYLKIALLTGQRRNKISHMQWSEIDWDTKMWTIPATKTKNAKTHKVPLSTMCIKILQSCPQDYDWVFTTTGKTPISGFSKYMQIYRRDTGLTDWRLHDLRRTLSTNLSQHFQVPDVVISAILNHSTQALQGVTSIYNKNTFMPERHQALEQYSL